MDAVESYRLRKRNKARNRAILITAVPVFLACILAAVYWSRDQFSPLSSHSDMTHAELLDHLQSRGLKVWMYPMGSKQIYVLADTESKAYEAYLYSKEMQSHGIIAPSAVLCVKHKSREDARQYAGRDEKGSFAWGVFSFDGNEKTVSRFREALR